MRSPRWVEDRGNKRPARWAEFGHPFAVTPNSDLVLLHPDGAEELLVAGGEGAIQDPYVSFDGEWIYYYDVPPPVGRVRPDGSGDEIVFSLPFGGSGVHPNLSMTPDARHFVAGFEVKTPTDIWLIESFDPDIR